MGTFYDKLRDVVSRLNIGRRREEFPVKIEAPDLNAEANDVPIEPIEVPQPDDEDPPDD